MGDPIDPAAVRVRSLRQWNLNGLDELVLGLFFCALAAIYLPERALMKTTFLGKSYATIAPLLQIACCLGMAAALRRLRAKLIFPRTGYVIFRPEKSRTWAMLVAFAVVVGIALSAMFWRAHSADIGRFAGPAFALVLAACFVLGGITYTLPHLIWLAGWSLVLGAATYVTGAKTEGAMWVMVGIGVAMAVSGAIRLRSFLRTHPIIQTHAIGGSS